MKDETLEKIANKIPKSFKNNKIYQKISNSHKEEIKKKVDGKYDAYKNKIKEMKDIEEGKRVFIIGTGPSIDKTNLDLLKNEIKIGVNTAHKIKNFSFDYFVLYDGNAMIHNQKYILDLPIPIFLAGDAGRKYLSEYQRENIKAKILPLKDRSEEKQKTMSKNLVDGIGVHSSVVHSAIQVAYYLGFYEVFLLGCDCNYDGESYFRGGEINKHSTTPQRIKNWFTDYEICKRAFEADGRKIYNATIGGRLEIFERKRLEDII